MDARSLVFVAGAPIDALTWESAIARIGGWAEKRESRVVCICNAHSIVSCRRDPVFASAIRGADMATADGFPVALSMNFIARAAQERINGPDLMLRYCDYAATQGHRIFLYGGQWGALKSLSDNLMRSFPHLRIVGSYSPPFRDLTAAEDAEITTMINGSAANVVWVGLGCPKQEKWMMAHRGRINAVMVGVGAAFDYHAGTLKRAPKWMQRHGLEWFYRVLVEPRRLWRRYLVTNTLFIWYVGAQFLRGLR